MVNYQNSKRPFKKWYWLMFVLAVVFLVLVTVYREKIFPPAIKAYQENVTEYGKELKKEFQRDINKPSNHQRQKAKRD